MSPGHDRVFTIKSRNFSIAKVCCCMGLYWSIRGCNLAAHSSIHASFILRRGLTRFQLPKGFLGLRIVECRNSSDTGIMLGCPYSQETSHSFLPIIQRESRGLQWDVHGGLQWKRVSNSTPMMMISSQTNFSPQSFMIVDSTIR